MNIPWSKVGLVLMLAVLVFPFGSLMWPVFLFGAFLYIFV